MTAHLTMPTHQPSADAPQQAAPTALVTLLATGAGLGAASLYYSQPLLGELASHLHASHAEVGWVPTLTQLGYASGILLLAPLGDKFDRRHLILGKTWGLAALLLLAACANGIAWLWAVSLAIGITATMAQDIVPAAAAIAPAAQRGRLVGQVMTGLLLGILLSRVVSGLVGQLAGWRTVYAAASVAVAMLAVGCARWLPSFQPSTTLPYGALLRSLGQLWAKHGSLRRAAVAQGLLSLGFSAFWSTLALMLSERFHLASAAAGAFGLAGAAGALAAPLAGKWADQRGPNWVTRLGAATTAVGFGLMGLDTVLPLAWQLPLLVVCTIVFDFGLQAALVAHQTVVYSLDAHARSRLNAILLVSMFVGMASGAALGSLALSHAGWHGVVGLATGSSALAWWVRWRTR